MGGAGLSPGWKSCNTPLQVAEIRWIVENCKGEKIARNCQNSFPRYWLKTYRFQHSEVKDTNLNTVFTVYHRFLLLDSPTILILPSVPLLFLSPLHTLTCHLKALQWTLSATSTCHILFLLSSFPRWEDLLQFMPLPSKTNDLQHSYSFLGLKM